MQYVKAFTFAAKKPGTGWKNLLLASVCLLIPVVGQIGVLGYRGFAASDLDEDPDLEYHRDFDFNKFGDYLGKGIWQFLFQFFAGTFVLGAWYAGMAAALIGLAPKDPITAFAIIGVGYLFLVVMIFLATMLLWPLELYAAMSEQFKFGRAFAFASVFARTMWVEMLLALIVCTILRGIVVVLGLLACCVGAYPALVISSLAEMHILVQLYRHFVDKGGTPIRDLDELHDLADED
jgi:hypothetical protein